jgi:selenocysteine lyase/cysteine desulfurase
MQQPLLSPDAFVGLDGVTHLCTGGESPWLRAQADVYENFALLKSGGDEGRREIYRRGESCRSKMGRLWEVEPERVGFTPSAAEGMSWLARGLDWREGDNVVTTSLEFPSVAYAWRNLKSQGVEIRFVPHRNWLVPEEDLIAAVDDRTRVLAVSQVSFYTGQCLDIEALATGLCRLGPKGREVLLAVDATHASGVVRVPVGATDLCVSSSYKWMLATHGVAPCYLSPRAEERAGDSAFGWHNLAVWPAQGAERLPEAPVKPMPERLEPGNPAMVVVMFLDRALQVILDIGIEGIQEHARDLSELVTEGLDRLGKTVISSRHRQARSGNTCFLADDARAYQQALRERGVLVWGEYGRVRVSGHLYNGSDDVDRLIEAMRVLG